MDDWWEERNPPDTPMTDRHLEAEIMKRADLAVAFLNDRAIQRAYHDLVELYLDQWLLTRPEELDEREELYREISAFRNVCSRMRLWVEKAARIEPKYAEFIPKAPKPEIKDDRTEH